MFKLGHFSMNMKLLLKTTKLLAFFIALLLISVGNINTFAANCYGYAGFWEQTEAATLASPAAQNFIDTGSSLTMVQAIHGTDNRLYFRTNNSADGSSYTWTSWQTMGNITVKSEPDVTKYNIASNSILLFSAFGSDSKLYTKNYFVDGTSTEWLRGGDITLKARPVTSFFSGKLIQSGFGIDNGIYTRNSVDGVNWTAWQRGGNITLANKVEQYIFNSTLFQFARGSDNGLYSRFTLDGITWTDWLRDTAWITVLDEPSTSFFDYSGTVKMQQVVRGTDRGYYFRSSVDGITWSSWLRLNLALTFSDKPNIFNLQTGCGGNIDIWLYGKTESKQIALSGGEFGAFNFANGTIYGSGFAVTDTLTAAENITLSISVGYGNHLRIEAVRGTNNRLYTRRYITQTIT
jgi:hypothetical protein